MQLEGYSNLTRLSQGGMATVYKAQQLSLDRSVAIKFLSAEFLWDEQVKRFFEQESRVIARLNHPNIIHIIDRGITPGGRPYFVMDYVQGRELSEINHQGRLSITARLQILRQTCKGMAFAHKNGVIHRDIKPANILIDDEGHVHILDFGIAWLEASGKPHGEEIVGTPDYMSPEQFNAPDSISPQSDIYSLGAVMYELFSGALPAEQFNNLADKLSSLPAPLSQLIVDCLQTDPSNRPATVDEVGFRLLKVLSGAHIKKTIKADASASIGAAADKFQLLDVISRSRFGMVYLFEDKARHNLIVVKKRLKSQEGYQQACQLRKLSHKHIIRVLGASSNSNAFIVVMEYLTGGSLQERLSRPYTEVNFVKVAIELCSAMKAAHDRNIMHGNLRPSNILFDQKGHLKVTDFGLNRHYSVNTQLQNWYLPKNAQASPLQTDIYSAGSIFYQMLTGSTPTIALGNLKKNRDFDALDPTIQRLLKNMLEIQSVSGYQSFAQILADLQTLQPKINVKQPNKTKSKIILWPFILLLILINLIGMMAYYALSPDFQLQLKALMEQLLGG